MRKTLTRREAISLLAAAPCFGALAACSKNEPDSCMDVSELADGERTAREALQYTDKSPHADKRCEICTYYQAAPSPTACGGCQLVKGPIHPKGYCTAYVAKT